MAEPGSTRTPDTVELTEHDTSDELDLSAAALDALEELNADKTPLGVTYTRNGTVKLRSAQYVGALSLPDGPTVRIRPKAARTNFLWLLTYAHGVDAATIDREVTAKAGRSFVDAFAALYVAELETILQRGPYREYRRVDERESRLRGRLDLPRQLRRQEPHATEFEVTYDDLTTDTTANRALYQAATRLSGLVGDDDLARALGRQREQLRRWITPEPVRAADVAAVETTRLNAHYERPLRLAEQVLRSSYLDSFRSDDGRTFGLLMDMNRIFERAVERAASEALQFRNGWSVVTQDGIDPIVTGDEAEVDMRPDFVVREGETVRLVGDAKWKTGSVRSGDVYQMTSYQLAHDVPGVLVYPDQDSSIETEFTVRATDESLPLRAHELPTATAAPSFDDYVDALHSSFRGLLEELCDGPG